MLSVIPEPDPTVPDPVAYFKAVMRELERVQARITLWMEAPRRDRE